MKITACVLFGGVVLTQSLQQSIKTNILHSIQNLINLTMFNRILKTRIITTYCTYSQS